MRATIFSPDRVYRYTLWRGWDMFNRTYAAFIGLNPSTADEWRNDPTVRRCIAFAQQWGYGGLCMLNAFAFRATDPRVMKEHPEPKGADNDEWIVRMATDAGIVIAAWGTHGSFRGRDREIIKLLAQNSRHWKKPLHCLGTTKEGQPKHPLYLPKTAKPEIYEVI